MTDRFFDITLPAKVKGWPYGAAPGFSTDLPTVDSGDTTPNRRWAEALETVRLPDAVRDMTVLVALRKHWLVCGGPAQTFPVRNPIDYASVDLVQPNEDPVISHTDQKIGVADNSQTDFQLIKTDTFETKTYVKTIYIPVVSSVLIGVGGSLIGDTEYTVSRPGGLVVFNTAPVTGDVEAGYFYDLDCAY